MEYTQLIFDGIRTLAICFGAVAAWVGMNTWRNQLIGTNAYKLAKRLLTQVFELQGIIQTLRSNFEPDESTLWTRLLEVGAEIDTAFVEARVHWGDGIMEHKKALLNCTNQLQLAKARMYAVYNDKIPGAARESAISEFEPIRYRKDNANEDKFANQVQHAVENLAKDLEPYLK